MGKATGPMSSQVTTLPSLHMLTPWKHSEPRPSGVLWRLRCIWDYLNPGAWGIDSMLLSLNRPSSKRTEQSASNHMVGPPGNQPPSFVRSQVTSQTSLKTPLYLSTLRQF